MKSLNKRLSYGLGLIIVIGLGLASRRLGNIPLWIGDSLWATAVYLAWRLILPTAKAKNLLLIALATAFLIEVSQLLQWPILVSLRATSLGYLLLGQGFLVSDLAAYSLGIVLIFLLDSKVTLLNQNL